MKRGLRAYLAFVLGFTMIISSMSYVHAEVAEEGMAPVNEVLQTENSDEKQDLQAGEEPVEEETDVVVSETVEPETVEQDGEQATEEASDSDTAHETDSEGVTVEASEEATPAEASGTSEEEATAPVETATVSEEATDSQEQLIDLSHESPNPWGACFGIAADSQERWQTFTAVEDAKITSVEVVLAKINADKPGLPDHVTASIRSYEEGQLSEPLATVTLDADTINSGEVTSITFGDVEIREGKQYAVSLTADPMGMQDNDHARFDWVNKNIGKNATNPSGKIKDGNVTDETKWVNTYWTKVYYVSAELEDPVDDPSDDPVEEPEDSKEPIDYSFEGTRDWGFSFGVTDGSSRWQTFTSHTTNMMTSFDVYLIKKNQFALTFPNLVATLYEIENNAPSKVLTTITKPSGEIETNGVAHVDMQYNLEKGKQYAMALSTDDVQDADPSTAMCYDWPTSQKVLETEEYFGKVVGDAFIPEALGVGYLKIYFEEVGPIVPKPTTLELSTNKTVLEIGDTTQIESILKDQFGELFDETITYESTDEAVATIDGNGLVTAQGIGIAKINGQCGGATASLSISVTDGSGAIMPVPGMVILEDTTLVPGVYDFQGASKGITVMGDDITLDGTGVTILNAQPDSILEDVTTGAYAYKLNPVAGKSRYNLTRHFNFTDTQTITFSYDVKATGTFVGSMKVEVKQNGPWESIHTVTDINDTWSKVTVDLSPYGGTEVDVRLSYDRGSHTLEEAQNMGLKLDTIELFEDGVRTFSDLAEAKVFYLWQVSYDDENPVSDTLEDKPFDRTAYQVSTSVFKGTGITVEDANNVTIKGFTVSGFYYALEATGCENLQIINNNFSNNYTNPNGGWGDQDGGAVILQDVHHSTITGNIATNNANGLSLRQSSYNTIKDNNFSVCSDVALEMWEASYNTIEDNDFSWGIRIDPLNEVHARDSTSSLIEAGSNYNHIKNNDFTHGGDGIFVRALNGYVSEGNVFEGNDTSFANNNAVESGMGRNYYINNKANWSSYGFWLGGSDESVLINNEIAYNGIKPCNAPVGSFGNAGISMKYWSSEHMVIVNNNIHDNNGSGIGMDYKGSQPSYHALIQNNRIVNNSRYAIHLDHAEWFEINGNLIEGNGYNNKIFTTSNASNIITRDTASYIESYEDYLAVVPMAKVTCDEDRYSVGEEVTFSAAESTDPGGLPLTYRWDMGDGTILTGETVHYTFKEPGFHDVAVTVTNGSWSAIDWINVNVVAAGEELGAEDYANNWDVTSNDGKTLLTNQVPNMDIPEVGGTELVDYPIYYVVDGMKSIKMSTTAANNTITYPKNRNGAYDMSDDWALSFSMKVRNQNRDNSCTPIVTLYTDEDNYITYTPSNPILSPFKYVDFTEMQYRHEWFPVLIPFAGNSQWIMEVVGSPDLEEINYISINTITGGSMGLDLWIDGMKTISQDSLPYQGISIASDGTASASSVASGDVNGPIQATLDLAHIWESQVEEESSYEVLFDTPRYMNQIDMYMYFKPTGQENDTIRLPENYQVKYLVDGQWIDATNQSQRSLAPDCNAITFDKVKTTGIKVSMTNGTDSSVAIYGFKVYDTDNVALATDGEGTLLTQVISSDVENAILDTIDMYICVDKQNSWPDEYSDFMVYLYEASEDGKGPTGSALATGSLTLSDIGDQLNQAHTITMRDENGEQVILESGKQYVIGATQKNISDGDIYCYRWPTSNRVGGEAFGKYTFDTNGVNWVGEESFLGTGWLRVHTNMDSDEATIDTSFSLSHSTGYGVGHAGEDCRYQTFTMPEATTLAVVDGAVDNDAQVEVDGAGASQTITMTFAGSRTYASMRVYLASLPSKLVIHGDSEELMTVEASELAVGFNTIMLPDSCTTEVLTLEIVNGQENTIVKEIEVISQPALTLTLQPNNGFGSTTHKVYYTELMSMPKTPYRYGYNFTGWYLGEEKISFPYAVTEDMTLVAHWAKKPSVSPTPVQEDDEDEQVEVKVSTVQEEGTVINEARYTSTVAGESATTQADNTTINQFIQDLEKKQKSAAEEEEKPEGLIRLGADLPKDGEGITSSQLSISQFAMNKIAGVSGLKLQVDTGLAAITFNQEAMDHMSKDASYGDELKVTTRTVDSESLPEAVREEVGKRPVYDFEVMSGKELVHTFGGNQVLVTLPYTLGEGEDPSSVIVYYLDEEDNLMTVTSCGYNEEDGTVTFATDHFSTYAVGYHEVDLQDIAGHEAEDAITFMVARGLFNGTAHQTFTPDGPMTKSMLIAVLSRLVGVDTEEAPLSPYVDVASDKWYASYIGWAYDSKIIRGDVGTCYYPEAALRKRDVAWMLQAYLTKMELSLDLSIDALLEDVPDTLTRADVCQVMKAFIEEIMN